MYNLAQNPLFLCLNCIQKWKTGKLKWILWQDILKEDKRLVDYNKVNVGKYNTRCQKQNQNKQKYNRHMGEIRG